MSIKLHYFNGRGICEPIRMILAYGDIPFEDIRAPTDNFPLMVCTIPSEMKAKCRWGQIPVAEFDGKYLLQSMAISRYFAKKANLIPEDLYEAALCDEYTTTMREFIDLIFPVVLIKDAKEREEKLAEAVKVSQVKYLDVFESIIKRNGGKHLVGDSITWADIYLTNSMNHSEILLGGVDLTEGYPLIRSLRDRVLEILRIKAYIEARPETKL